MKRPVIGITLTVVFLLVAAVALYCYWPGPTDDRVPSFTLSDLSGETRSAADWRGEILVLNFWASWCKPCREEIPMLIRAQKELDDRGVQIVGLAVDRRKPVQRFVEQYDVNYPVLLPMADTMRLQKAMGGGAGLPFTVVVDRGGRIHARVAGRIERKRLDALLAPLLHRN